MASFNDMTVGSSSQLSQVFSISNTKELFEKLNSERETKMLRKELDETYRTSGEKYVSTFIKTEISNNPMTFQIGSENIYVILKNNSSQIGEVTKIESGQVILVGRSIYCDISTSTMNDNISSRFHLIIYRRGDQVIIADFCSTNGTYIEGNKIRVSMFNPKEKLKNNFCFGRQKEIEIFCDQKKCVICLENNREVILKPCGHFLMCTKCTHDLIRIKNKCPNCNVDIKNYEMTNHPQETYVRG